MREGGLWGLRPSAIPHLTPYIGVLHDCSSVIQLKKRKSLGVEGGLFLQRRVASLTSLPRTHKPAGDGCTAELITDESVGDGQPALALQVHDLSAAKN